MGPARLNAWMPVFWGDYVRDTGHLNNAGHGAYLMLIKHYWCTGRPLNDNDDELWRIACCDNKKDWMKLRAVIVRLFQIDGGLLHHKRVDAELAKAVQISAERRRVGAMGGRPRAVPRLVKS